MKQLYTRWGRALDPAHVREEYPRPQLRRASYCCLNGTWKYRFSKKNTLPDSFDGQILVPFSPESRLSGVGRQLKPDEFLWYERKLPPFFSGKGRLLLHFGAVDQFCRVYINGQCAGSHASGYLPFTVDITEPVKKARAAGSGAPRLSVCVQDVSDTSWHARGKQKLNRGGMYYTAQSGLWQSVWMEEVPEDHVLGLDCEPDADQGLVTFRIRTGRKLPVTLCLYPAGLFEDLEEDIPLTKAESGAAPQVVTGFSNEKITVKIEDPRLWDGETPYLYPYSVTLKDPEDTDADRVESYFALRTFSIEKDEQDLPRLCLNHTVQFERGVLDQGYWPDGLLTAPADAAFVFDITAVKDLGYNMIRKHVKVEDERWYYHCDRLGMIVWQDMVNGGTSYQDWYVTYLGTALSLLGIKPSDRHPWLLSREDLEGKNEWAGEMLETIRLLKNHPCIAVWTLFNEGWGQFNTKKITEMAKKEDPSRLIDAASGWFDQGCGDFVSTHNYFFPMTVHPERERASILSEFGGYTLTVPEHSACEDLYGYGDYDSPAALQEAFEKREAEVNALIPQGLCASIYTQISDIEDESNGIFTWDREVQKLKRSRLL